MTIMKRSDERINKFKKQEILEGLENALFERPDAMSRGVRYYLTTYRRNV